VMMATDSRWLYVCIECGHETTAGLDFRGTCPKGHSSWLCHLVNHGSKPKILRDKPSEPIGTPAANLSQAIRFQPRKSKPGPKPRPLENIVSVLASQGLSSRVIAAKRRQQGISVSYKTIQRRVQGSLL
jgi:hypothetical protein